MVTNAISIDVEDYFQVSGFEKAVSRKKWEQYPSRVVNNTRRLLAIFERHQVTATFFVLGWVAERFPFLVKEIYALGHEVGSHGYWHRLIYEMSPSDFRNDLIQSISVLQDITGQPITSFRAPSFSITKQSLWALDILAEEGITQDSSIFPTHHDRYGIPDASPEIHQIATTTHALWEFPMSVTKWRGLSVPTSGGGYFRLYPYRITRRLISQINETGRPLMFYLHPWEIDPQQPLVDGVPFLSRKRHRINLAKTEGKLERLLTDFKFTSMTDVLKMYQINRGQSVSARSDIKNYSRVSQS